VAAIAACAIVAPAEAAAKPVNVKVMTRNVFLGADLGPALTSTTQVELFEEAAGILEEVRDTNFPSRSRLLAEEIAAANPHIVGLQEVALLRRGPKGTFGSPPSPAAGVVYDFLDILRNDLRKEGARYRVGVVQAETDFQLPLDFVDDDQLGDAGDTSRMYDGRLTMRDVILVRRDVGFQRPRGANFNLRLPVDIAPVGAGPEDIQAPRGWTSVDANVKGARFRLVNTHLEAFHPGVRLGQASELTVDGGPTTAARPVVLLGDLNTDDELVETDPGAIPADEEPYALITERGWLERSIDVPGLEDDRFACCYPEMDDPLAVFDHNVDHVMVDTPSIRLVRSFVTGDDEMTPDGLWPSDHGGVVSVLKMRRR
jgi:endonuclease/exonuclease/phosphatase family metal-dependent hydrolase